jgi:hypothetical protein
MLPRLVFEKIFQKSVATMRMDVQLSTPSTARVSGRLQSATQATSHVNSAEDRGRSEHAQSQRGEQLGDGQAAPANCDALAE